MFAKAFKTKIEPMMELTYVVLSCTAMTRHILEADQHIREMVIIPGDRALSRVLGHLY